MIWLYRIALLSLALATLAVAVQGQALSDCVCGKNKRTENCTLVGNVCKCKSIGLNITVDCGTLTSKCLLMKAEMTNLKKGGRRQRPKEAFKDNDGIYDPECGENGAFKAKQCNGTSTCWCVNSAGVRRTEKSEKDITCNELVRTSWIIIEMKADSEASFEANELRSDVTNAFFQRYQLHPNHVTVTYEKPFVYIDLKQNGSQKSPADVDIADVAYYFEKDVKEDSLMFDDGLRIEVAGKPVTFQDTLIYYRDDKPPEFSMKHLSAGVIAVVVVVVLAIVAGILVLVFTNRKRGKYEKAEVKEMNEMNRELNS